jgi:hypothetical protein
MKKDIKKYIDLAYKLDAIIKESLLTDSKSKIYESFFNETLINENNLQSYINDILYKYRKAFLFIAKNYYKTKNYESDSNKKKIVGYVPYDSLDKIRFKYEQNNVHYTDYLDFSKATFEQFTGTSRNTPNMVKIVSRPYPFDDATQDIILEEYLDSYSGTITSTGSTIYHNNNYYKLISYDGGSWDPNTMVAGGSEIFDGKVGGKIDSFYNKMKNKKFVITKVG